MTAAPAPDPFSQMSPALDSPSTATALPDVIGVDPAVNELADEIGNALALRPAMRAPRATYRIQFQPSFGFRDAAAIVPYLSRLGVDTIYASPVFQARPGSTHGYDIVDYGHLNDELGGEAGFVELRAALDAAGMHLVLDFVPNHMGIGSGTNSWWLSVLEHGRGSPYGSFFDIDWEPLAPDMRGRVLLPVLGDQYGVILESGELRVQFAPDAGIFRIAYYDNVWPVAPETWPMILDGAVERLGEQLGPADLDLLELQSILTAVERLPSRDSAEPDDVEFRQRETLVARRRLADLVHRSPAIAAAVETAIAAVNGEPGDPASFDLLDRLLDAQVYRLAYWRVAAEEINYRRFFAINDLASIRQEDPVVFHASHDLLLRLLASGDAQGVRIDHIDGLLDPAAYTDAVQHGYLLEAGRQLYQDKVAGLPDDERPEWADVGAALSVWLDAGGVTSSLVRPVYLLVEKILEHGEHLPATWAVDGTTGYEFANAATGLFVDPASRRAFDELYAAYIGERRIRFGDVVYEAKRMILREALASELAVLVNQLDHISTGNRRSRDFTPQSLRTGLREIIAGFLVYRTYVAWDAVAQEPVVHDTDRAAVDTAIANAARRNPGIDWSVFAFIRDVMLVQVPNATDEQRQQHGWFAVKVQQLSGPVMAKGLEDTAFFRYVRLLALNEVGGDPSAFGTTVSAFHAANRARLTRFPDAMVSSSTHDTKRSEDVRARMAVLSELPREWRAAANRWARFNRRFKTRVDGDPAPDRNDEYAIYQTILGAWPFGDAHLDHDGWETFVTRVVDNAIKAAREASVHTSWIAPTAYEDAISSFIRTILDPDAEGNRFFVDVQALRQTVSTIGMANGLAQQVLKLTVPGMPDIYQGTEFWDFSLTDPDNRREVDFGARAAALDALSPPSPALVADLVGAAEDGRIKQFVTRATLGFRAAHDELFRRGGYDPLEATGPATTNLVAFARRAAASDQTGSAEAIVVVPRLTYGLTRPNPALPVGDVWSGSTLALPGVPVGTRYRDIYTGEVIVTTDDGAGGSQLGLDGVFRHLPVALLERVDTAAE